MYIYAMKKLRNELKGKAGEINPVKVYENVDLQKLQILAENKGKAGVYLFTNLTNGKSYVGSSVNLSRRFYLYYNINHLLKQISSLICRALLKHGYSNFKLEILEYCDPKNVIKREQYYMDLLNPEYNVLKTAGSSLGRKHSVEAKAKISQALLGKITPILVVRSQRKLGKKWQRLSWVVSYQRKLEQICQQLEVFQSRYLTLKQIR